MNLAFNIVETLKHITMASKNDFPKVIENFISAMNSHDGEAFINAFADDALVNDVARNFRGKEAIKKWSDEEILKPKVTFETDEVMEHYGDYLITALTNGEYDKSKAPDPLYLDYFFSIKKDKIIRMFVFLNKKKSVTQKT
jgi:ketosteroid isomerase-like protein